MAKFDTIFYNYITELLISLSFHHVATPSGGIDNDIAAAANKFCICSFISDSDSDSNLLGFVNTNTAILNLYHSFL